MNKELFAELYSDPRFVKLVKEALKQRPQIPAYDPKAENTEIWKSVSSEQRGFDIWVTYLRIPEELKNG